VAELGVRIKTGSTAKKFSDNASLAVLVFIEVDIVGGGKLVNPKVRTTCIHA
jgi:hypothetical protein